jgi:hypothetical protein
METRIGSDKDKETLSATPETPAEDRRIASDGSGAFRRPNNPTGGPSETKTASARQPEYGISNYGVTFNDRDGWRDGKDPWPADEENQNDIGRGLEDLSRELEQSRRANARKKTSGWRSFWNRIWR